MGTFSFLRMHVPAYVYVCVCVHRECVYVDGIASRGVQRLSRIDGGGDSQAIIFSLMVPGGQRAQTKDTPAPPSPRGRHAEAAADI